MLRDADSIYKRRMLHDTAIPLTPSFSVKQAGSDVRGGLGSCPGASTTKGPPQKNSKKYYIRKHKKYFLKLIIWNKK